MDVVLRLASLLAGPVPAHRLPLALPLWPHRFAPDSAGSHSLLASHHVSMKKPAVVAEGGCLVVLQGCLSHRMPGIYQKGLCRKTPLAGILSLTEPLREHQVRLLEARFDGRLGDTARARSFTGTEAQRVDALQGGVQVLTPRQ